MASRRFRRGARFGVGHGHAQTDLIFTDGFDCVLGPEVCNGRDDDCDRVADNDLVDTGQPCGSSVGMCETGLLDCCQEPEPTRLTCTQSGVEGSSNHLACLGRGAAPETCNGVDDDCDGATDEDASRSCYPFAPHTEGVGVCRAGAQSCNAVPCGTAPDACCPSLDPPIAAGKPCPGSESFSTACVGAVGPSPETCNGLTTTATA